MESAEHNGEEPFHYLAEQKHLSVFARNLLDTSRLRIFKWHLMRHPMRIFVELFVRNAHFVNIFEYLNV
ncbi:MAG: hypothetical protein IJ604_09930 [Prevotella sp.]|nr:hypothetical protein [Prevotella sp.]